VIASTDAAIDLPASAPTIPVSTNNQQTSVANSPPPSSTIQTATIGDPMPSESPAPTPGELGILNSQQIVASTPTLTDTSINRMSSSAIRSENISDQDLEMFNAASNMPTQDSSSVHTSLDSTTVLPPSPNQLETTEDQIITQSTQQIHRQPQEVSMGTSVQGRVTVPLVWSADGKASTSERGAIELTQPLLANDGSVALPAGTTLITQTVSTEGNHRTDIIAVIRNRGGTVQQYPLPANILIVRGENGGPIDGRNINQVDPSLLRGDDLLVGLLGGLGQIGEVLNRPQTQSNSSFDNGGFSQNVITQSRDPNIIGAILQGALEPASQRIERRLQARERTRQEQNLPNVKVLERGAVVTIVAQNILKVNP